MNDRSELYTFIVDSCCSFWRLDRFLALRLRQHDVSREKIKKAVLAGACTVGPRICREPSLRLEPGQSVSLTLPEAMAKLIPEQGEITVLHEDDFLAVLDKPGGLTVHPCPSCPQGTLVHRLAARFPVLLEQEGERPGIVHRLDKDTSGLLIVALSEESRLRLSRAFADRHIRKEYLALVRGVPAPSGKIEAPIGRDPAVKIRMAVLKTGRPASTEWQTLYADDRARFSLLRVRIHTGRTHQIRVHMAHIGHPLWGDALYGPKGSDDPCPRQMLHAWRLSFAHPFSGKKLSFSCPPPEDFWATADRLDRRMQRVVLTGMPGCGKSTLLGALNRAGPPTWSADAAVARLYQPGAAGWQILLRRYGERFVPDARGPVNRHALGHALMTDAALKREVENAIHPLVREELEAFWISQEQADVPLAIAEVPLWFESGWKADSGYEPVVVGVRCEREPRYARLALRRNWSQELIAAMDSWQWDEDRKMRGCSLVVTNNGTEDQLVKAAPSLLYRLEALEAERRAGRDALWRRLLDSYLRSQ